MDKPNRANLVVRLYRAIIWPLVRDLQNERYLRDIYAHSLTDAALAIAASYTQQAWYAYRDDGKLGLRLYVNHHVLVNRPFFQ